MGIQILTRSGDVPCLDEFGPVSSVSLDMDAVRAHANTAGAAAKFTFIINELPVLPGFIYTGCNRRKRPDFGRVFLMLNYTEKPPKHLYPKLNGLGDNGQ